MQTTVRAPAAGAPGVAAALSGDLAAFETFPDGRGASFLTCAEGAKGRRSRRSVSGVRNLIRGRRRLTLFKGVI
jgi:hypothetical protein